MVPSTGGLAVVPVLIGISFLYISKHIGWDTWKMAKIWFLVILNISVKVQRLKKLKSFL